MAAKGTRGYSSYHGRRLGKKIAAAIVLTVILLCALAFLRFQDYIVFDEHGAHFEFPQSQDSQQDAGDKTDDTKDDNLVVDIQQPANEAGVIRAATVTELSGARAQQMSDGGMTAVVYAVMGDDGKLAYESAVTDAVSAGASGRNSAMSDGVAAMKDAGLYTVARMSCFRNDAYAKYNSAAAIKNVDNNVWYDGNIKPWLDPYSDAAAAYIISIASECANAGYSEILLDNAFFPTYGRTERLNFSGETATRTEAVNAFLTKLGDALAEYDVNLAVSVPAAYITGGSDADAGFDLKTLPDCVKHIYVDGGDETALRSAYASARPEGDADAVIVVEWHEASDGGSCLIN